MKLIYAFSLIIGLLLPWGTAAQSLSRSVIGSTGSANEQLSYTVGEAVINTVSSGNIVLTQGFQQPDGAIGTFLDPYWGRVDFRLYPNPTLAQLTLEMSLPRPMQIKVSITDARGRRALPDQTRAWQGADQHSFDVRTLATGTYYLSLRLPDGTLIRSFGFQKLE